MVADGVTYWKDLEGDAKSRDSWIGLRVDVPAAGPTRQPSLVVEANGARLLRVTLGGRPIVWARHWVDRYGYDYLRAAHVVPNVLPPLRFEDARDVADAGTGWYRAWAKRFARELGASTASPLHAGVFGLIELELEPPRRSRSLEGGRVPRSRLLWDVPSIDCSDLFGETMTEPSFAYADWNRVLAPLALRAMSSSDDGRVKSYRKLARAGSLPPLLLWWVGGLDRYVLLDGHDRLHAAALEGQVPRCLALLPLREEARVADPGKREHALRAIEALHETGHIGVEPTGGVGRRRGVTIEAANEVLTQAFDDRPVLRVVTRMWPLEGGARRWEAEVRAEGRRQRLDTIEKDLIEDER